MLYTYTLTVFVMSWCMVWTVVAYVGTGMSVSASKNSNKHGQYLSNWTKNWKSHSHHVSTVKKTFQSLILRGFLSPGILVCSFISFRHSFSSSIHFFLSFDPTTEQECISRFKSSLPMPSLNNYFVSFFISFDMLIDNLSNAFTRILDANFCCRTLWLKPYEWKDEETKWK